LVCYIRKYVIILGGIFLLTSPQPKYWGGIPGIPGGVDASANHSNSSSFETRSLTVYIKAWLSGLRSAKNKN